MGGDEYLFCLLVWQPDVGGAGPDAAGAPGGGGALHPALHKEHLEEQLPAGRSGCRAPLAGLLWLRSRCPQHHGTVSEQGHGQVTAAQAPKRQEICEYYDLWCQNCCKNRCKPISHTSIKTRWTKQQQKQIKET